MQNDFVQLAITSGEPAGIGPQISIQAAQQFLNTHNDVEIHLLGDSALFSQFQEPSTKHSNLIVEHVSLNESNTVGVLNPRMHLMFLSYWIKLIQDVIKTSMMLS